MRLIVFVLILSFNCFAKKFNALVIDPNGDQVYLKGIVDYFDKSKILFKGELTDEQVSSLGGLVVRNGIVEVDPAMLALSREKKNAEKEEKDSKKIGMVDAIERLKASKNKDTQDIVKVLGL